MPCNGDDDDDLVLWNGYLAKGLKPCFQPRSLADNLNIANLRHAASMI